MTKIIDGLATREKMLLEYKAEIEANNYKPKLVVILVGENKASKVYVKNKVKVCKQIGIESEVILYDETISEDLLLSKIQELNNDPSVNGILVQLPLPQSFDEENVLYSILPEKDVDCFNPSNMGKLFLGNKRFRPCTPYGIITLLEEYNVDLTGKNVCILGRSNIVGKPMAILALERNATVTVCHSKTENLKSITSQADILIVAIGKAHFITKEYVKEGAVVIDVGIHRMDNGKLCGDVVFDDVYDVASMITPVPGGVGPMTIAILMKNCLKAYRIQNTNNEVK
ncbi:MAG: bifunctional 5,10-methylenetetrahydrofolate dehydrogenase/5,10-methenyltetrahydrofolate cyclohydrolase [Lachnospirales bacterium]